MKNRVLTLLLISAVMTASLPAAAAAQTNTQAQQPAGSQDWQELQGLRPGTKIVVEFKTNRGEPVEGKFVSAAGSELTLTTDGYTRSLAQGDVRSVYALKGRWSRGKAGRIGAVIGALAGAFIGTDIGIRNERAGEDANTVPAMGGLVLGGLAGAALGRLLGGKRKGRLLYEAE